MRPTVMEVSIQNFKENVRRIKEKLPENCKIMPVMKAKAYGTYLHTKLELLNEFDIVAVAMVDEGKFLREIGYQKEIFVLNQPAICEIEDILENNLVIGVAREDFIKILGETKRNVKIHIEIDTGMGRTGILEKDTANFINFSQSFENIQIDGIYTHLSIADIDEEYTRKQLENFEKAVKVAKEKVPNLIYIHCSASNGIVNFKYDEANLARPGMLLYGYSSGKEILKKINLKPVCTLKSKINFLKTVPAGTSIGYGRSFITPKEMKIATIPIGYADGLRRELSNRGEVFINGKKVPIIGKVCMDSFMTDVTEITDVVIGDDVWIWDNENITLEEIAEKCHTTNYEIISTISDRVPRIFV